MDSAARAVDVNVTEFLLEMGRLGGGTERRDAHVMWTVGGSPIDYHNAVVACDASPSGADALIGEWVEELRARRLSGSWHVSPFMRPHDLPSRLAGCGFADGGDEPAMVFDLAVDPVEVAPVDDLDIEFVHDASGLSDYRDVLGAGFGEGPREADWVASVYQRAGWGDDAPWRHLVGRLAGQPACTTTLFMTVPVAGIYFVCTAPEFRRRGLGASITRQAMLTAKMLGCTSVVLASSRMGDSTYRRLGFTEVFRYHLFEWSPPATS